MKLFGLFRLFFLLPVILALFACAGLMQSTSVMEAYKKYDAEKYQDTLELIVRAENAKAMSSDMQAELAYLKARTHEKLGQQQVANTLYDYLIAEHGSTQYGYLARAKMSQAL